MGLQFILGSSGAGKTHTIFDRLIKRTQKGETGPFLLIVPEQFTLQTQQDLIQMHPNKGIMEIEVLSFARLAFRINDDLAMANRILLNETGKSMVIRKIVQDSKEKYKIISKSIQKKGYVKELKGLITELYQYDWDQTTFDRVKNEITNPLLMEKLNDTKILFEGYKQFVSDKYITLENSIDLLSKEIKNNAWLENAEIYLDGFYGFTPIQYKVIKELLKKTKNLSIAITIDAMENVDELEDEGQLFYESKKLIYKLKEIAEKEKIEIKKTLYIDDREPYRYKGCKEISHLEKNLFRYPYESYTKKTESLIMCQASTMRKEIQYVSDSIMKLVMDKKYRFKDIGVITGNLMGYETIIKQTFDQYAIPYFMDKKKPIRSHPLVEIILSTLEILNSNFSYSSVFRYIKTGLLDLEDKGVDRLENYVLAYGIRGEKAWQSKWINPYPNMPKDSDYGQAIMESINDIKDQITCPLIAFKKAISKDQKTVMLITQELFGFIRELGLEDKINSLEKDFEKQKMVKYEKEYSQIFKLMVDILDQIVEIVGNEKISLQNYISLLQAGFEDCEMGLLPPSLDQVVIGDLNRTRLKETKALFVIGFNEGIIPSLISKPNILSDLERIELKNKGVLLAPDHKENIAKEQFNLYMALSKTSEKLYLSYAKSDLQGKTMRSSLLFNTIKKIYTEMKILDVDEIYLNKSVINKPRPTFYQMVNKLNRGQKVEDLAEFKDVYIWFYMKNEWKKLMNKFEKALDYRNDEEDLSLDHTLALYGKELNNSVSRLESFAKCPYLHFVDYGLRLKERVDYSVKMPDIGILFHKSIDKCSQKIEQRGLSWGHLDNKIRDLLVEESVKEVIDEEQRGIFLSSARNSYLVKRLIRVTKRALWAISNQISKGEFKPIEYEYGFDGNKDKLDSLTIDFSNERSMKLSGRVDRVDAYEEDDLYVTVVDYKSGNQSFDMVALYYGLQLQLLIYLNSVIELKKGTVVPAGIFYFHIHDPIIKDVPDRNQEYIEEMIMKELKLKGLVLNNKDIIKKLDSSIEKTSQIIPVALTTNGEISKNSSVASLEQFEHLNYFVQNKVKEIAGSIVNGELAVLPYKRKNESACDYCKYLSICRFEPGIKGNDFRHLKELTKDEIWDRLKNL